MFMQIIVLSKEVILFQAKQSYSENNEKKQKELPKIQIVAQKHNYINMYLFFNYLYI